MKNGDLPAMPTIYADMATNGQREIYCDQTGLTKREQLAMAAMQGLCADIVRVYENLCGVGEVPSEYVARQAVFIADALLAELEKSK